MDLLDQLDARLNLVRRTSDTHAIAACPVHKGGQEAHPSFSVHLASGHYRCFSCGITGNFESLKKLLGYNFDGVNLMPAIRRETNDQMNESVLALFRYCPVALADTGFSEATLLKFEVGYDMMYERITFPIRAPGGRLVAISGRAADGVEPRYKVYTGTMLRGAVDHNYAPRNKSWLYGGHLVPKGTPLLYVVEGYKACLWLKQHGVDNVVATMGTKVTPSQITHLQNLADRVIVVFDNDVSGRTSGKIVQQALLAQGVPATVLQYPGAQPDNLSPEEIKHLFNPAN